MSIYKFNHSDIVYNRIKTYPRFRFFVYDEQIYINDESNYSGSFVTSSLNTSTGQVSLYELNVDRLKSNTGRSIMYEDVKDNGLIYPFITKDGTLSSFKTVSAGSFATFGYGTVMSSSYPLTASLRRKFYQQGTARKHITALRTTLDYYNHKSAHHAYSSSLGNKGNQDLNLISIPSILFGSSIKQGSVSLKYYLSGTLLAELVDRDRTGELIQVSGTAYAQTQGKDKVAGVVLYNEGFIMLTGSWALENPSTIKRDYINDPSDHQTSAWKYWGTTTPGDGYTTTSGSTDYLSYQLDYKGTNYVPVMTMLAHAPKGELNYSNNPTFVKAGQRRKLVPVTGSRIYREIDTVEAKNTMTSSYADPTGSYQKQTFITKIGLYDDHNNLIAIATLANPVKKLEDLDYTFKLKLDF